MTCEHGDSLCVCKLEAAKEAVRNANLSYMQQNPRLLTQELFKHATKVHEFPENFEENCSMCLQILLAPLV